MDNVSANREPVDPCETDAAETHCILHKRKMDPACAGMTFKGEVAGVRSTQATQERHETHRLELLARPRIAVAPEPRQHLRARRTERRDQDATVAELLA